MARTADRLIYSGTQAARVAWYFGHYLTTMRRATPRPRTSGERKKSKGRTPTRTELIRALRRLFVIDWQNIRDGTYLVPEISDPAELIARSRDYFKDLSEVDRRRVNRINDEVPDTGGLPRYYRQNFHYQTDGWLSRESAARYDFQVETLFTGAADAMRRQALPPIRRVVSSADQRQLSLLDIACGTGRFLREIKHNFPALKVTGLDLSPAYLEQAAANLKGQRKVDLITGKAEDIPLGSHSQDIVTCVYLFHELPPKIRLLVAAEIARVLKPGGCFVFVDSIQPGDVPDYDAMLSFFPVHFHEPYFESYGATDLDRLFGAAGLRRTGGNLAFLSKVVVYEPMN